MIAAVAVVVFSVVACGWAVVRINRAERAQRECWRHRKERP